MTPVVAIYLIWIPAFLGWMAAAILARPRPGALRGRWRILFHLGGLAAIGLLLSLVRLYPRADLQNRLWTAGVPDDIGWVLFVITASGLTFSLWAVVHRIFDRGRDAQTLYSSGPYRAMPDPVGAGLVVAAFGVAAAIGQFTSFAGALLLTALVTGRLMLENRAGRVWHRPRLSTPRRALVAIRSAP